MTFNQFLRTTELDRSDAFGLLQVVTGRNKASILAHGERELTAPEWAALRSLVARRAQGEPLAYITNEKEFYGLRFRCTTDTLVPRPDTELLVEVALLLGDAHPRAPRVCDLGTGTGCIAITLARERQDWELHACDVSPATLAIAQHNADRHAPRVRFHLSHWFDALPREPFDLLVSNPPYIARDDAHLEGDGLRFEPRGALTDEGDGLEAYRVFAKQGAAFLASDGALLMEHGFSQAPAIAAIFTKAGGWKRSALHHDLAGLPRVSVFTRVR